MQRRKASGDEAWLLSYADLITNLLIFFVMLLSAAEISRPLILGSWRNVETAADMRDRYQVQQDRETSPSHPLNQIGFATHNAYCSPPVFPGYASGTRYSKAFILNVNIVMSNA